MTRRTLDYHQRREGQRAAIANWWSCSATATATRMAASWPAIGASIAPSAGWRAGARARRAAGVLPRPRRHHRPRRGARTRLSRSAARRLAHGPDARHRAGRSDRAEVRQPRHGDVSSGAPAGRRHPHLAAARGRGRARRIRSKRVWPRGGRAQLPGLPPAGRARRLRRVLPPGHAHRRHRADATSARGPPAAPGSRPSRTCAPSRGSSVGARRASICPAGTAWARRSSGCASSIPRTGASCAAAIRAGRSSPTCFTTSKRAS